MAIGHARRRRRLAALAAGWAATSAVSAAHAVLPLAWDASTANAANPLDGTGTWTGLPTWSNGSANVLWADGQEAYIGNGTGTAPYTLSLAADVSAALVEFDDPGPGASYTLDGNGHALLIPNGGLTLNAASVRLTNVTLVTGDNTGNNPRSAFVQAGGVLTLGTGSTLAAAVLSGDFGDSTVRFDGGTFRALANPAPASANQMQYVGISAFSAAYVSAGGLTVDTSAVRSGIAYITDPLEHDPTVAGPDGGLTVTGGGLLQIGYTAQLPPFNPVATYTGTTTVTGNTTLRLNSLGGTSNDLSVPAPDRQPGPGAFPNTRFAVDAGSTLAVTVTDGLVGQTGSTPVTLNGGTLTLGNGISARTADVTLNGGTMTAPTSASRYTVLAGHTLRANANATVTVARVALSPGATVRADAGVTFSLASPLVDGDTPGQLTAVGPGTVNLSAANTYTGPTNVAAGTVTLTPTGSLASPALSVAAEAMLTLNGSLAAAPTLTTAGTVTLGPVAGATGVGRRSLGAVSITAGGLTLTPSATSATRTALAVPSLSITGGGRFDLGNGDLIVSSATPDATLADLTAAAATGFAGGAWTGPGLDSATAGADANHLTAVGVIRNASDAAGTTPIYTAFDGQPATAADVLARLTYYGDANLDGRVDAADYSRLDAGFLLRLTGWLNGDFNYDGVVDASDYTLADNAFNRQTAGIATPAARVAAARPTSAVPEPGGLTAVAVALGTRLWRRRRPPVARA